MLRERPRKYGVGRVTLGDRELVLCVRILDDQFMRSVEDVTINRQGGVDTVPYAGHFKIRLIVQGSVYKHRAGSESSEYFGEIERHLRWIVPV